MSNGSERTAEHDHKALIEELHLLREPFSYSQSLGGRAARALESQRSRIAALEAERDEANRLREADLEFAWESGAAAALRSEGYEVVAHAAVFEQNPYKPKGDKTDD